MSKKNLDCIYFDLTPTRSQVLQLYISKFFRHPPELIVLPCWTCDINIIGGAQVFAEDCKKVVQLISPKA